MAVNAIDWLELIRREYLSRFVPGGGSAIKFIVAEDPVVARVLGRLETQAKDRRLQFVAVDAAATRLHMIQDVFFSIARQIDWDLLAQRWVEAVFRKHQYEWAQPGKAVPLGELASVNRLDERLLRREVQQWLTADLIKDREMAQDFRFAMTHLCMRRMEMADERAAPPVIEWLNGELRTIGAVRQVPINSRITRHNGRAMLRSLCRWLRLSGGPGLAVTLDIRQLARSEPVAADQIRYSPGAVLDAFEVLRQLIDDIESFEGLFLTVLAGPPFTSDDTKRGVAAYTALKERLWADVHARGHENPLAPLLHISEDGDGRTGQQSGDGAEMPFVKERVAVEALRAGVPNRAAIGLLGTDERELCARFLDRLKSCKAGLSHDQVIEGDIVAGGFGTGKSHLLGYLAQQALQENFIVSQVVISKETPLFDAERLFAAAMRNAIVPGINDDVMTAVVSRLKTDACDDLEKWASVQEWPLFAALCYLLPRQVILPEDTATIARFFGGSKLDTSKVRQWLRAAGALQLFDVRAVRAAQVTQQRLRFAPRLFAAAGYSGWCILIDEMELIGRYSTLQRGKSYAELCRWLGLLPEAGMPGVVGVCAITDDFRDRVLYERLDREKVPQALEAKGLEPQARLAETGMAAIERRQHFLAAPDDDKLRASIARVRGLYEHAYGWSPPPGSVGERMAGKTMRQFIKSWITGWDIQRIFGKTDEIDTESIESDYTENKELEQAPALEAAEEDAS